MSNNFTNWHQLAKERSTSQESQSDSQSDSWCDLPRASESNLSNFSKSNRRSLNQDIRKSTLMKRFWESSRGNLQSPSSFPSSFAEWQHGGYRQSKQSSSKSLLSLSESPKHRPTLQQHSSSKRHFEGSKTEEDSYIVYTSTETARTDVSDPYPSTSASPDVDRTNPETRAYRINNSGISETSQNDLPSLPIKYQFEIGDPSSQVPLRDYERGKKECPNLNYAEKKTNLNVITNVELSQSTLNVIFNQVMQDVLQHPPSNSEVLQENVTKQKAFNWKLNVDNSQSQEKDKDALNESTNGHIPNCSEEVIGKINIGSPYRNKTTPVLRLSALPRTTSMEVNTSSNDSFDKDSDTSLVDSLDDPASPRLKIKQTNINITKETTIVEDNLKKEQVVKKSSVFYIPIDDPDPSAKTEDSPQVSNSLPSKLRDKLLQRQLKREEKRLQERLKSFDLENGNLSGYFSTSSEMSNVSKKTPKTYRKATKTSKTTLPQIDLSKEYTKNTRTSFSKTKKTVQLPKSQAKTQEVKKSSKKIEILEIMEIVEPERAVKKSRIPVFQHSGLGSGGSGTKLPKLKPKPTFLDFGEVGQPGDPKLDQLIANILIDTLNHEDIKDKKVANAPEDVPLERRNNNGTSLIEEAADILTKQVLGNNNLRPEVAGSENTEDIPKGWITFYMLQKTQSPESTSDEGKTGHEKNEKFVQSNSKKCKLRRRMEAENKTAPGWSVTFSNTNVESEEPPEVEMKFKFPTLKSKRIEDKTRTSGLTYENICNAPSEIQKSKRFLEKPNLKIRRRQIILSPRATKTSKQRSLLNRQKHFDQEDLPHLLSISGSGLHQIRRLPRLSQSVLRKLLQNLEHDEDKSAN